MKNQKNILESMSRAAFAAGCACIVAMLVLTLINIALRACLGISLRYAAELSGCLCAAGAGLGHNFPFYMHFKGGKGIAATAGMVLSFHPWFVVTGVVVFFTAFFTTHYVSLGSLLVYSLLIIQLVISGQMGLFAEMTQGQLVEMYILFGCMTALAFWKHRENIGRLLHGTERKTYLTHKNKVD